MNVPVCSTQSRGIITHARGIVLASDLEISGNAFLGLQLLPHARVALPGSETIQQSNDYEYEYVCLLHCLIYLTNLHEHTCRKG